MKERRRHPRYTVKDNILLFNGTVFAEIVNISQGGLYCRFLTDLKEQSSPIMQVDLINAPDKLFVEHISCNDLNWFDMGTRKLFNTTVLRNCRLEFSSMDESMQNLLGRFIQSVKNHPGPNSPDIKSSAANADV